MLKFGAEGGILDIVDFALQADLCIICSHACAAGSQMGMIIRAEEYIRKGVLFADYAKKSSH
jgi:hypothetical protein